MANPQFKLRSKRISLVNKFTHCSLRWKPVHFSEGTDPLLSVCLCYHFLLMGLWITPISVMWCTKNPSEGPSSISSALCLPKPKYEVASASIKRSRQLQNKKQSFSAKANRKTKPCEQQDRLWITGAARGRREKRVDYWWPLVYKSTRAYRKRIRRISGGGETRWNIIRKMQGTVVGRFVDLCARLK